MTLHPISLISLYMRKIFFSFYQCSLLSEDDIVVAELEDDRIVVKQKMTGSC
jgi:hypothetical protein